MTDTTQTKPTKGNDWCPRGCQPLYELGECGMCGHQGDGVFHDQVQAIIDVCEVTGRYARQSEDGRCYDCGQQH